jgi:hypothetical protein
MLHYYFRYVYFALGYVMQSYSHLCWVMLVSFGLFRLCLFCISLNYARLVY